ncbi:MAG: aminoacyl-tRNA hydrolase [bacterium]
MVLAALGNYSNQYKLTRHNVGFLFVDWLTGENDWEENKNLEVKVKKFSFMTHLDRIVLDVIKPTLFMNESGRSISKYMNFYKINSKTSLMLVFDDLDLELGNWKVQKEKGPKVHNGVNSVEQYLGTKDFLRIRVGVYNKESRIVENGEKISGADYVLQPFTKEEFTILYEKVFPQIKQSLGLMVLK